MSSSYGWTDREIGDLPLARFRQITAAIQVRKFHEQRTENGRFSWLARTLASYTAAGYMTDGKSENKALKQAATLAMDEIESALLGVSPKRDSAHENNVGSYERFMGAFGNGGKKR